MAVTFKLGAGVLRVSPEASIFLANQMWLGKQDFGVTPGTIVIETDRMIFKKMGMPLGALDFQITPLFVSNGILHYFGEPQTPLCNQAQIWAFELCNA